MSEVAVLVAVYNAEPFLARCLDSLLGQTLANIQIICIDDASTDGSAALLQRYAMRDARIEVLQLPENHGQAYARNQGLEHVVAPLVCFLDADDWLEPDALQRAVERFVADEAADCVLFSVSMDYPDHSEPYPMPTFDKLCGEEAFRLSLDWQIHGVYMVRTSLHLRFPYDDSCRIYSDDNTTRLHYLLSRYVCCCSGVYHYVQHSASVTHAVSVRRFDFLRANESMKHQLDALGCAPEVLRLWEQMRWLVLVDCYMFYHVHGRELSAADSAFGLSELHRVWQNIDRCLLDHSLTRKFGYRPMPAWWCFRLQEWLYFSLRGLFGKNK